MSASEIDETLLTAYALGEIADEGERSRVAAWVASDASAREFVDDTRASAGVLIDAFQSESATVDGLTQLQVSALEQQLRDHARDAEENHFVAGSNVRPAHADESMKIRMRHWVPLAASLAASVAIVAGAVVFALKHTQPGVVATDDKPSKTTVAPQHNTPGSDNSQPKDDESELPFDGFATNAAPGDDGPVEGMVDPLEFAAELDANRRNAEAAATTAQPPVVPAPQSPAPKTAVASNDAKNAPAGPVRSAEAERVRGPVITGTPSASIDPKSRASRGAADRLTKSTNTADAARPRLYENPFRDAKQRPRSSFPVRVEANSYPAVRASLLAGKRPAASLVRIEEMINRFAYDYAEPAEGGAPLAASVEIATCPWNVDHRLARVAINARDGGATVVARGVDVAVAFNPAATAAWRLIGYENAPLSAGQPSGFSTDLAAGGTATALYEIVPTSPVGVRGWTAKDLFTVTVHYREPHEPATAPQHEVTVNATDAGKGFDRATDDFRFTSAVAAFGMLLRDSQFQGTATHADVMRWANAGKGADQTGERAAFIDVVKAARDQGR